MSSIVDKLRMATQMIGPVHLAGLTLPDWLALLRRNHWRVDLPFWPRVVLATLGTAVTSTLRPVDRWLFPDDDEGTRDLVDHPVFVLGMARSGTTMLFNLLAQNPYFGYPSRMDCFYPHIFRTLHRVGIPRVLGLVPGQKRSLDSVRVTWLSPEEDTLAISVLSGVGERLNQSFPREPAVNINHREYGRLLRLFSTRLVQVYRRNLLFKSPGHFTRIPAILEQFPQARFVTIFRDPRVQFRSTLGMREPSKQVWGALQWAPEETVPEWLTWFRVYLARYFVERDRIPPENVIEIRYEDLAARQNDVLQSVYRHLRIPEPAQYPAVEPYTPNKYPEFDPALLEQLRDAYHELHARGFYP